MEQHKKSKIIPIKFKRKHCLALKKYRVLQINLMEIFAKNLGFGSRPMFVLDLFKASVS